MMAVLNGCPPGIREGQSKVFFVSLCWEKLGELYKAIEYAICIDTNMIISSFVKTSLQKIRSIGSSYQFYSFWVRSVEYPRAAE